MGRGRTRDGAGDGMNTISTQTARDIAAMIEPRSPKYADEIIALAEERDMLIVQRDAAEKKLKAHRLTSAECDPAQFLLQTSSAEFDIWYNGLNRIHPRQEFESDDQFLVGDLVEAFEAGRSAELERIKAAPVVCEK